MEIRPISYSINLPTYRGATEGMVKLAGIPALNSIEVAYLESSGNYTVIHFNDGHKSMVAITLMLVAKQLPALIRIHKSYAIAATSIGDIHWVGKLVNKRALVITMRNKVRIAVSRRKAVELAPALSQLTGIVIEQ